MNAARWYPTNTTLGNGDVLVSAGTIDQTQGANKLPQVWQVATNTWRDLTTAQLSLDLYPWMHLAPDGRVINTGPFATTRYVDTSGTGSWTVLTSSSFGFRDYGTSVMYDTGKVLIVGGGDPPTATAEVIDLNATSPSWRAVGSMASARRHLNATVLPDGNVLATGGSSGPGSDNSHLAVQAAEMWNPATETWTSMASYVDWPPTYRGYHSTALLLPDGRVLSAGGDGRPTAEIYSPPYLFKGPRPTVTSVPSSVAYGETFVISSADAANISQVTWIRLSSVTHAINMDQRFSRLPFTQIADGLSVTAPANPNGSPPGYYMLFAVNSAGVPSVGAIVRIGTNSEFPPAAPENFAASGVSPVRIDLTWQDVSADEIGLAIERCQSAECTDFMEIARVGANITMFANSALTPGTTYVYRVRAFNGAGYSPYTVAVTATTADPIPPVAPTDLSVEPLSFDRLALSWVDNSTDEDGFTIERCEGETCSAFHQIAQVGRDTTTFTDSGLSPETFYRYRARAFATWAESPLLDRGWCNDARTSGTGCAVCPDRDDDINQ